MKLYGYWRSSSSWRVRTVLAIKDVDYDYEAVHLVKDGGQQHADEYKKLNPMEQVPLLVFEEDGRVRRISQSMAIMEYLEERFPEPSVIPGDPVARAHARQLAEVVNSGIQPLQNLATIQKLRSLDQDAKAWCAGWISDGLDAYETMVAEYGGDYSVGDTPTIADACLVPQMYNARRFDVDLEPFPRSLEIEEQCLALDAFQEAHPSNQPDAQE